MVTTGGNCGTADATTVPSCAHAVDAPPIAMATHETVHATTVSVAQNRAFGVLIAGSLDETSKRRMQYQPLDEPGPAWPPHAPTLAPRGRRHSVRSVTVDVGRSHSSFV